MAKRMLIDTTHPEETRVVVLNGTRLEQFDVETSTKKQIKGNIYLAKVIRVEPSLQAAFVEYGGGRHGFLAFSEIHPDYYQIPVADRQALLAEEAARAAEEAERENVAAEQEDLEGVVEEGGDVPAYRSRRPSLLQSYKIQEVIKRRQIMLVQVVKEERGNKGAALTTYLSLAGRYCVLMPNTARGGGVSRKITNAADRKRLKEIMSDLDVPSQMAVILRTAGQERSRAEIKRDYEYLIRTWVQIRDVTMQSCAPALVHEEGNLIKRAIRDIYSTDIDEVMVEGEDGYRVAKDFMKILTPSHARRVQPYRDPSMPLFHRFQVDSQLDAMHNPTVQLKSGGYIVINQTEALVAIDVNSGRATRERHIEETALKTNLEAAEEVARQLRLRDLAGLVVIDFIDMEEPRNNAAVERRLKEALRLDRARIQVGRISMFGLLELSRQRLRPSLMETSFQPCPRCAGTGMVRSVESAAVHILRAIEEEGVRRRASEVVVHVATPVALYVLNNKRAALTEIEQRYALTAFLKGDDSLIPPECRIERLKPAVPLPAAGVRSVPISVQPDLDEDEDEEEGALPVSGDEVLVDVPVAAVGEAVSVVVSQGGELGEGEGGDSRKRRKRRRRRRRDGSVMPVEQAGSDVAVSGDMGADDAVVAVDGDNSSDEAQGIAVTADAPDDEGGDAKRRRRSRRGGRRRRRPTEQDVDVIGSVMAGHGDHLEVVPPVNGSAVQADVPTDGIAGDAVARPPLRRVRRVRRNEDPGQSDPIVDNLSLMAAVNAVAGTGDAVAVLDRVDDVPATVVADVVEHSGAEEAVPAKKPVRKRTSRSRAAAAVEADPVVAEAADPKPKKRRASRKAETSVADANGASVKETSVKTDDRQAPPSTEPAQQQLAMADAVESDAAAAPRRGWWKR
ncbi:Rne/Rng family ribonuclease [Haematospirillum jordaniae]|uniref:Ribonuclease E n=1 Tax=Haematospirillum jordaniae TaxID=1549855 RepID=A0A143DF03_9PROT|nr:ribonuclease E/G [Haematospirillum jordaniae]AMW34843.1 ribonuclease E [Haematospirillum jordaniae]NKD56784.1 Rne/Rng family ribonuclease [Haematospirillum jordaniae]NKD66708.1 Rne/Rng family ribonuclease [Haematospirillum jordaniae]NKD79062.1 Rne/Rng family ribonuclease [Haematospirillum jordaniae]NKD82782.1 Rne/Rng family ribonuclease [Haematospirillum jordaniae]